jgi:hypothetical protein
VGAVVDVVFGLDTVCVLVEVGAAVAVVEVGAGVALAGALVGA